MIGDYNEITFWVQLRVHTGGKHERGQTRLALSVGALLRGRLSSAVRRGDAQGEIKGQQTLHTAHRPDNIRRRELHEEDVDVRGDDTARGEHPRREPEHHVLSPRRWLRTR